MTSTRSAHVTGALSRLTAAGLTTKRIAVETPDGPITLTMIGTGTGQRRPRGNQARRRADRDDIEMEGSDAL